MKASVQRIVDGDGFDVSTGIGDFQVRLDSIDAPEWDQPGGKEAKETLEQLIDGYDVYLEIHGKCQYGRTIACVFVMVDSELMNVNEKMVAKGHAWVVRQYSQKRSGRRQLHLNQAEKWAKEKRYGLWRAESPIAPWDWRKGKKSA